MAIRLKERLLLAAELAGTGNTVMDVGCDHAHLDIYLLQTGRFARAVAMDIGEGPLESARENIELTELSDRCELRRSDGLTGRNCLPAAGREVIPFPQASRRS